MLSIKNRMLGFTLIEIVLSVSLISIIAGFGIGLYHSYSKSNDLSNTATTFVSIARRAMLLSQAGYLDSSWSLFLDDSQITLFRGSDFAMRDTEYDEVEVLAPALDSIESGTYTGQTIIRSVTFDALNGLPNVSGVFVLHETDLNMYYPIFLNEQGTITY